MNNTITAVCQNSFKIAGRGIILELQHALSGIEKNTILTSRDRQLSWKVDVRVLYDHAVEKHTIFENEQVDFMLMKFTSLEKKEKSILEIAQREENNIYTYLVKPIGHSDAPVNNEQLELSV